MRVDSERILVNNGKHNAFPSIAHFKKHFFISYRSGSAHMSDDGEGNIIISEDLNKWTNIFRFRRKGLDVRDTKLFVFNDKLFLLMPVRYTRYDDYKFAAYLSYSDDGLHWHRPVKLNLKHWGIWQPFLHKNTLYASFYRYNCLYDETAWELALYKTNDGLEWLHVNNIYSGKYVNETAGIFHNSSFYFLIRREKYPSLLAIGKPEAIQLNFHELDFPLHSPFFFVYNNRLYVTGREFEYNVKMIEGKEYSEKVKIYAVLSDRLQEVLTLKSGISIDCGYPSALVFNNRIMLTYYYGTGLIADIYLTTIL